MWGVHTQVRVTSSFAGASLLGISCSVGSSWPPKKNPFHRSSGAFIRYFRWVVSGEGRQLPLPFWLSPQFKVSPFVSISSVNLTRSCCKWALCKKQKKPMETRVPMVRGEKCNFVAVGHFLSTEPRKKPSYFPLYWLVHRDPYIGIL